MKSLFYIVSICLAVLCGYCGWCCWRAKNGEAEMLKALPRQPMMAGMAIGVIDLVWSAYHGAAMLEGGLEKFRIIVWILVPVTVGLSYFYLDYVNGRAFGGFMTLCANHLINAAFVYDVPGRSLYCVVCLLVGCFGMVGIGIPWRYRDLLLKAGEKPLVGLVSAAVLGAFALILLIMPWFAKL